MLEKLTGLETQSEFTARINEIIDILNAQEIAGKTREQLTFEKLMQESDDPDFIAGKYNVKFQPDEAHGWDNRVYCARCGMHSQSLRDRVLRLPGDCEGCAHAMKFGGIHPD